jgi:hypothetical protein
VIRDSQGRLARVELEDAALAVSDLDCPDRPIEHQGYYVRDCDGRSDRRMRRTDAARSANRHAAVLASQALVADALTKCVLLCEEATAERAAREFGATRIVMGAQGASSQ